MKKGQLLKISEYIIHLPAMFVWPTPKKITICLTIGYEQVMQMVYYCEMLQCLVLVVGCYLCGVMAKHCPRENGLLAILS